MTAIQAQSIDKQSAQKLVHGLFRLLKDYAENRASVPNSSQLEHYLSNKIRLISNERAVCRNIGDFLLRIREVQKHFEEIQFSDFLEEPLVADQKIVLRFHIDGIRSTGQKSQFQVFAILTVNQGKISEWIEILHEKGSGDLEPFQELTE